MDNIVTNVFGLDNIIGIIFLVFMITTWYLRREASKREHDARLESIRLKHDRDLMRDKQFYDMHSQMLSLLRECQVSVARHLSEAERDESGEMVT